MTRQKLTTDDCLLSNCQTTVQHVMPTFLVTIYSNNSSSKANITKLHMICSHSWIWGAGGC